MSDSFLRYAPRDPQFLPAAEASSDAEALLRSLLPQAQAVRSVHSDDVMFIDCGGNWLGVRCSACGAEAETWWRRAMSAAFESRFVSLKAVAPCCGATVQLNELNYPWPVAFGRYMLEALNANSRGLSSTQLALLSAALGTDLVEVAGHL